MNSDFDALLSLLARHRVKYLVVGGYAVIHYCEPRYTKDIDIFVEACRPLRSQARDHDGKAIDAHPNYARAASSAGSVRHRFTCASSRSRWPAKFFAMIACTRGCSMPERRNTS